MTTRTPEVRIPLEDAVIRIDELMTRAQAGERIVITDQDNPIVEMGPAQSEDPAPT